MKDFWTGFEKQALSGKLLHRAGQKALKAAKSGNKRKLIQAEKFHKAVPSALFRDHVREFRDAGLFKR